MDEHIYESDYGEVEVTPLKIDGEDVLVRLEQEALPMGTEGDESWVYARRLTPIN